MKYNFTILLVLFISSLIYSQTPLPTGTSELFAGSGNCATCHVSNGEDVLTENGKDVSPVTYWRSTMMANASKDPFWRAVVSEEVAVLPDQELLIETTCTKCHSPMGYYQAIFNGEEHFTIEDLDSSDYANDGVSCTVCHQIDPANFGTDSSYSGNYYITDDRIIYGPYQEPLTQPMAVAVNYFAQYGEHMNQSELCATCHTLFTPYFNYDNEIVGDFPEQTPYIEWKNSDYPAQDIQCQDCHMPKTETPIDISTIPPWHEEERTPFWYHEFVGGNVFMLKVLQNNIDDIGVTATEEQFDSTISRSLKKLREQAVNLIADTEIVDNSLLIKIKIENLAGHKLPTGIPFRRMWIHLKVTDDQNNIVFESGEWNSEGEILHLSEPYEPHYDLINSEDKVQIYEGVMVDVNNDVTYTLLRSAELIKDNRIPPKGFTSSHESYDTVKISGNAEFDLNFNKENDIEGNGSDEVYFQLPFQSGTEYNVFAELCFQTVKPAEKEYLATIDTEPVNNFISMYEEIENEPVIMKSISFPVTPTSVDEFQNRYNYKLKQNYPNPFNPVTTIEYQIPEKTLVKIKVYDLLGNEIATLVNQVKSAGNYKIKFNTNDYTELTSGIYFYSLKTSNKTLTKKFILLK